MITAVVSTVTYIPFTLLDLAGDPVTGKVNADFTKSAYLVSTPATTATATVTENASGTYRISFTPTVVGIWHCTWSVTVDGETVRYEETVQVVTAAQADPFASAPITGETWTLQQQIASMMRCGPSQYYIEADAVVTDPRHGGQVQLRAGTCISFGWASELGLIS